MGTEGAGRSSGRRGGAHDDDEDDDEEEDEVEVNAHEDGDGADADGAPAQPKGKDTAAAAGASKGRAQAKPKDTAPVSERYLRPSAAPFPSSPDLTPGRMLFPGLAACAPCLKRSLETLSRSASSRVACHTATCSQRSVPSSRPGPSMNPPSLSFTANDPFVFPNPRAPISSFFSVSPLAGGV